MVAEVVGVVEEISINVEKDWLLLYILGHLIFTTCHPLWT